jgi:hypothetical protein
MLTTNLHYARAFLNLVDPPINTNTPLIKIIISKPNAQQSLINILDIQMDPLVNPLYNVMCLLLMTRP